MFNLKGNEMNRRNVLKSLAGIPVIGTLFSSSVIAKEMSNKNYDPSEILQHINKKLAESKTVEIFNIEPKQKREHYEFAMKNCKPTVMHNNYNPMDVYSDELCEFVLLPLFNIIKEFDPSHTSTLKLRAHQFIERLDKTAFTLLKFIGKQNKNSNVGEITDLYGSSLALSKCSHYLNYNIHVLPYGLLNDSGVVGIDRKRENNLKIAFKSMPDILCGNNKFYMHMEVGLINLNDNGSIHYFEV